MIKNIIACAILVAFVAVGAGLILTVRGDDTKDKAIVTLRAQRDAALTIDSVNNVRTTQLLDSIQADILRRDAEIAILKRDLNRQRRQNEELLKKYNSLRVTMPEF